MKFRVSALIFLSGFLLSHCSALALVPLVPGSDSLISRPDSILTLVDESGFRFDSTFSFRGSASYNDGERQQAFAFSVRMRKDSVTWLSLNVAGIEAVRALFTRDSARIYLPLNGEKLEGDYGLLRSYVQYPLDFSTLNNLLLGNLVNNRPTSGAVTENDTAYTIFLESAVTYQQATSLKKNYRLLTQLLKDKISLRELRATFDRQEMVGEALFSLFRNYELNAGGNKATIAVKVNRTELNKTLNFPF